MTASGEALFISLMGHYENKEKRRLKAQFQIEIARKLKDNTTSHFNREKSLTLITGLKDLEPLPQPYLRAIDKTAVRGAHLGGIRPDSPRMTGHMVAGTNLPITHDPSLQRWGPPS